MTDDLVLQMRRACSLSASLRLLDQGADEIDRLRALLRDLLMLRGNSWHEAEDKIRRALGESDG